MINLFRQLVSLMLFLSMAFLTAIFMVMILVVGLITMIFNRPKVQVYHHQRTLGDEPAQAEEDSSEVIEVDYKIED